MRRLLPSAGRALARLPHLAPGWYNPARIAMAGANAIALPA
ncbi:MAG TPA: hypothetical protein VEQ16_08565 [Acidocella sp.]|jgi:hypothetical protein|nr:hypothetical protein [Acidocella sp.]